MEGSMKVVRHTMMIQMLADFHVAVPAGGNVEIALNFVPIQTPINPTVVQRLAPPTPPRRLLKLPLPRHPANFPKHMRHMRVLLLLPVHFTAFERVHALGINPVAPGRRVARQHVPGKDAVTASVLDVDVQVAAFHGEDDVEVDLELVGDALFDAEEVGFVAMVPAEELGEGEEGGDYDEGEGSIAARGAAAGVGGLGFRC